MPEQILLRPKTPREKLQNYWYHYKWHTLAGLFIAVVLAVTISQCANRVQPDCTVILNISKSVPSEITTRLETELSRYVDDVNGDGQKIVTVMDCSYDPNGNPQMNQAAITKIQAELAVGDVQLFIMDNPMYNRMEQNADVFETLPVFLNKDGKAYNLAGGKLYEAVNEGDFLPINLYIAKRKVDGTAAEKSKKAQKNADITMTLLERMIADNPQPPE